MRELLELAALVSLHGPTLVRGAKRVPPASVERYWVASKSRLDRWGRTLKTLSPGAESGPQTTQGPISALVLGVLEEILTGEVLTRVWTALMCACDRRRGSDLAEPIVRSVLIGHLEARHRVLTLLVRRPAIDAELAVKLNQLRRRTERWTDMLLARMAGLCDVREFAFDFQRTEDFVQDASFQASLEGGRHAWPLIMASLWAAFRPGLSQVTPNSDLNMQIAESVLSAFPSGLFDSMGLLQSLWMMRVSSVANDAQGMLDELLSEKPQSAYVAPTTLGRISERLRRFRK